MNRTNRSACRKRTVVVLRIAGALALWSPGLLLAAEFNVAGGDVPGLIDAINAANANGEADTINLAAGGTYTLTEVDNDISFSEGPNGLPSIVSEITINGNNAIIERSADAGTPDFRIFHVWFGSTLTLNALTISNGFAPSRQHGGGGIFNRGAATLTGCTVSGNHSLGDGGGIANSIGGISPGGFQNGVLTMTDCTVSGNTSEDGDGGGIGGFLGRALTMTNCVISGNSARWNGGGIARAGATMNLVDCTVRGNTANSGGGLYNPGSTSPIFALTLTHCTVSENVAQDGGGIYGSPTMSQCTVRANTASFNGGGIRGWPNMVNCTVSDNVAYVGGGIWGGGALARCIVDGNTATFDGGGIWTGGPATLTQSTLSNNSAGKNGGGIFYKGNGTLTLLYCTLSGNAATNDGGGIYNENFAGRSPTVLLTNCTLSNNAAANDGGGIFNDVDDLRLHNCTVSGNTAGNRGDGILNPGTLAFGNTIMANSLFGDCVNTGGTVTDNGFNIVEDGTCISDPTSMSGDPLLGPLADNGGPTMTHVLMPGSIAIDEGDCSGGVITLDQRGMTRPAGAACDIGAFEADASPCVIPALIADGDGVGLTAAIDCANVTPGPDTINLAVGGTYTLTAVNNATEGPNGLPSITSDISINGNNAVIERSADAGTPEFRIFHIAALGSLTLNDVTVSGGASSDGGGISNAGGSLTLKGCTIRGNTASFHGGAVRSRGTTEMFESMVSGNTGNSAIDVSGDTTIADCTVADNVTDIAIAVGSRGATAITGSTVSGNSGMGIQASRSEIFLTNTTISGNTSHGLTVIFTSAWLRNCTVSENGLFGFFSDDVGASVSLSNTIVANNGAKDCDTPGSGLYVTDNGYNIDGDGSCIGNATSRSGDPLLGPLTNNGGPTMTHALLPGSIAINAGDCAGGTPY